MANKRIKKKQINMSYGKEGKCVHINGEPIHILTNDVKYMFTHWWTSRHRGYCGRLETLIRLSYDERPSYYDVYNEYYFERIFIPCRLPGSKESIRAFRNRCIRTFEKLKNFEKEGGYSIEYGRVRENKYRKYSREDIKIPIHVDETKSFPENIMKNVSGYESDMVIKRVCLCIADNMSSINHMNIYDFYMKGDRLSISHESDIKGMGVIRQGFTIYFSTKEIIYKSPSLKEEVTAW